MNQVIVGELVVFLSRCDLRAQSTLGINSFGIGRRDEPKFAVENPQQGVEIPGPRGIARRLQQLLLRPDVPLDVRADVGQHKPAALANGATLANRAIQDCGRDLWMARMAPLLSQSAQRAVYLVMRTNSCVNPGVGRHHRSEPAEIGGVFGVEARNGRILRRYDGSRRCCRIR
jgi:hypothetical protein